MSFSVVIITYNEEENIEACLKALKPISSDIVVVDSFSDDKTVELSKKFGAKIIQKQWEGYTKNKNYGHQHCKHDWILSIDADEVLSKELQITLKNFQPEEQKVYSLNRLANYGGQWVRHCGWHPDWKVRLFNRNYVKWQGDFVHETLSIPSHFEITRLPGLLHHYSYKDSEDHLERIERYAKLAANEMHQAGKKSNLFKMWGSPIARFIKTFFIKKGILDGRLGFHISCRDAYLVFRKYQLLKELRD